jgi:dipeptidyl-peptidase-4
MAVVMLGLGAFASASELGLTAEDYALAERFLSWNASRYVSNGDIQPHWLVKQDRFWYLRVGPDGRQGFVLVDAATGKKSRAFDQEHVARALSRATGEDVRPGSLPFVSFEFVANMRAIEFAVGSARWRCSLEADSCEEIRTPLPGEIVSPDGRWSAYLRSHNVWIRSLAGAPADFALTHDGEVNDAYGVTPQSSGHAISDARSGVPMAPQVLWSPDSRFLLTYELDERAVGRFVLLQSVPPSGSFRPRLYNYRYPLAGDPDVAMITPVVLDVVSRRAVDLSFVPFPCLVNSFIGNREAWWSAGSKRLYYISRDRYVKSATLHVVDLDRRSVSVLVHEESPFSTPLSADSVFDNPVVAVLDDGRVIWYSQRDGWGHLYVYSRSGKLIRQLTRGSWVVRQIAHFDAAADELYFVASGRQSGDPYQRFLYSISLEGGASPKLLTPESADHENVFSPSGRYFVDTYSRPDLPAQTVVRRADGHLVALVEREDISRLRSGGWTPIEPFEVTAADGVTKVYGNLFRPSHFAPGGRYPVIDSVYPGPQMIRTRKRFDDASFDVFEAQSLAELGFVVVTIDGRGTPNRSAAFLRHSYGHLERASELEDHITGIRQLAQRYPYIDVQHVGVDGASAGGYVAVAALLRHPEFYDVGVAAEGDHDLRGYLAAWADAHYGPGAEGMYQPASNFDLACSLRGSLLLAHGDMDENVPPGMTLNLVDRLIRCNRDFDLLIVPNQTHALFESSPYFIRRKWDYFVRHLLGGRVPERYLIAPPPE